MDDNFDPDAYLAQPSDGFDPDAYLRDNPPPAPTFMQKLEQTWPVQLAERAYHALRLPGDVASGAVNVTPTVPGQWSDEDEARLQATNAAIQNRTTDLAAMTTPRSVAAGFPEKIAAPTIQQLKETATGTSGYKNPVVQDVRISAAAGPRIADQIIDDFNSPEIGIDANVAPKTFGILNKLYNVPDDSFLTVNNLRTLRRTLGNAAGSPDATERLAAKSAQQHIDEFLANMPPEYTIQGDPKAAAAILKEANANYSAMKSAADFDVTMTKAQLRSSAPNSGMNLGNTIRQRMADIYLNPKLRRGYTQDELDQMRSIVEGTPLTNTGRMASNILGGGGGLGSAITGLVTHGVAPVAGYTLRRMVNSATTRAARQINEAVRARSPLGQQMGANLNQRALPRPSVVLPTVGATGSDAISMLPNGPVPASADTDENRRLGGRLTQQKHGGKVKNKTYAHGLANGGPAELGILGSSVQGPLDLTKKMGTHANWQKFESEARPSTNVEDERGRFPTIPQALDEDHQDLNNALTDVLYRADGGAVKDKVAKAKVHYRVGSKDRHCSICTMWKPPHGCSAVKGTIAPKGVCDLYKPKH